MRLYTSLTSSYCDIVDDLTLRDEWKQKQAESCRAQNVYIIDLVGYLHQCVEVQGCRVQVVLVW